MCTKKISTRYFSFTLVLLMILGIIGLVPPITSYAATVNPNEANYHTSCWGIAKQNLVVYDDDKHQIGSIYAGEGFTVIGEDLIGNPHETAYMINYYTSSGDKTGYIEYNEKNTYYTLEKSHTCAGIVNTTTTVYYGKNTDQYQTVGSVSTGKIVSVLAQSSGKCCIEFNTTSGRKRGWCSASSITQKAPIYGSYTLGALPCDAEFVNSSNNYYNYHIVYSGPSEAYFHVGYIGNPNNYSVTEPVYITAIYNYNNQTWAYITYSVPGNKDKSGYIKL